MTTPRSDEYDVAIAGAGPAGASLAIRLATAGRRVLLVEQKKFPREKLCGEFISPECLKHFAELGIMASLNTRDRSLIHKTVFYTPNGRNVTIPSSWFDGADKPALGLSRAELDLAMLDRAKELGVVVCEETAVAGLVVENDSVRGLLLRQSGEDQTCRSRLTIDATGRNRSLSRFIRKENRPQASHVAFKTHLANADIENNSCEIYSYSGGYGGCNFVENGLANVCFIVNSADARALGSDPERAFRERLMTNTRARSVLERSSAVKPWLAVPIDRYGRGELSPADGLLSVGDAAGFIDPFTGSGILLALESSEIAAAAVGSYFDENKAFARLSVEYSENYSRTINSRLRISSLIRGFAYSPLLARTLVAAMKISPKLTRRLARATRTA